MPDNELYHYGIKGQRWNDRRYQYEDGSLTPEGKIRYGVGNGRRRSSGNYRPNNNYHKSKVKNNIKINKNKKSNYNMKKDLKKSVKSIDKDKSFVKKANDFLATPLGKAVVGTAIAGIVGIGIGVLKEVVMQDVGLHSKPGNGKTTVEDITKGFKVVEPDGVEKDYTEANKILNKIFKNKK